MLGLAMAATGRDSNRSTHQSTRGGDASVRLSWGPQGGALAGGIVGAVVQAETGAAIERAMVIALLPGQATESMMSLLKSMQSMGQTDGRGQFNIRSEYVPSATLRMLNCPRPSAASRRERTRCGC